MINEKENNGPVVAVISWEGGRPGHLASDEGYGFFDVASDPYSGGVRSFRSCDFAPIYIGGTFDVERIRKLPQDRDIMVYDGVGGWCGNYRGLADGPPQIISVFFKPEGTINLRLDKIQGLVIIPLERCAFHQNLMNNYTDTGNPPFC